MTNDPTERIMEIFGIPGFWNLVWLLPLVAGIGVFIAVFWPFGKGPEGPPYVGFDPGEKVTGTYNFNPHMSNQYRITPPLMAEFNNHQAVVEAEMFGAFHSGQPCSPQCWRKPDGHRWGDEH